MCKECSQLLLSVKVTFFSSIIFCWLFSFQGRHEVVSLLLDRKANVEHRAKTGLTPLMEAASGGYVDVGRVLLDKGADVNAPPVPSSRDTALTIAADKGHYRFVELLLSRGAQVN
jgi:ankyrin repeat domain-containing protein 17